MNRDQFQRESPGSPSSATWGLVRPTGVPDGCFADEVAIGFPSVGTVVDRMRDAFLGACDDADVLSTEVRLSWREASRGRVVPLEVPVRGACPSCGGRGETWAEPCPRCLGTGNAVYYCPVRVSVPAGVADGARIRFRVGSSHAPTVRVEVRVAVDAR